MTFNELEKILRISASKIAIVKISSGLSKESETILDDIYHDLMKCIAEFKPEIRSGQTQKMNSGDTDPHEFETQVILQQQKK